MSNQKRIYLDNAATSWPKPESVLQAMDQYNRENGMPLGRTSGSRADDISRRVAQLRLRIQQLVGAPSAKTLFTFNGTDALNLAIHGTLRPGDHVVTTVVEHNSVLRPLRYLEDQGIISVDRVECDPKGVCDPSDVINACRPNTSLVAMIHCSNVTGTLQDVQPVGDFLRKHSALFLVDAAQSLGSAEIDFDQAGIDLLASPGHKGLWGPLGTGVLVASQKAQQKLRPIRQGGTGVSSDSDLHPSGFPDAFEAGNHNVPGLIGLCEGLKFIEEVGVKDIGYKKEQLASEFAERLSGIEGVRLLPSSGDRHSGIVSFTGPLPPSDLAVILDSSYQIQIRAGFHCASLLHSRIGSEEGCARVSFGYSHSRDDVEIAAQAVREIVQAF